MSESHSYYRYNGVVACGDWLFTPRDEFNAIGDDAAASLMLSSAKSCAAQHNLRLDFKTCVVLVERIDQGELFDDKAHTPAPKKAGKPG